MTITGAQLMAAMPDFFRLRVNLHHNPYLWENHAVLGGNVLYVSKPAYQLIADDAETRDDVFKGLIITIVEPVLKFGKIDFYEG